MHLAAQGLSQRGSTPRPERGDYSHPNRLSRGMDSNCGCLQKGGSRDKYGTPYLVRHRIPKCQISPPNPNGLGHCSEGSGQGGDGKEDHRDVFPIRQEGRMCHWRSRGREGAQTVLGRKMNLSRLFNESYSTNLMLINLIEKWIFVLNTCSGP